MAITIRNKVNLKGKLSMGSNTAPAIPIPPPGTVDGYPDFDFGSSGATFPTLLTLGVELAGQSIVTNGDRMTYVIYLSANETFNFEVKSDGDGTNDFDTEMYLYDENGGEPIEIDDDGGEGAFSKIEYTPEQAGYYYIGVMGFEDASTGDFSILADVTEVVEPALPGIVDGFPDFDLSDTNENPLSVGDDPLDASISSTGDRNVFYVNLSVGQQYTVYTEDSYGDNVDTVLYVYRNSGGVAIDWNDDHNGVQSSVTFVASYDGLHYFGVMGKGDTATGDYYIRVVEGPG